MITDPHTGHEDPDDMTFLERAEQDRWEAGEDQMQYERDMMDDQVTKDAERMAQQLAQFQVASRALVEAVDALEGVAEMPLGEARTLAVSADVVRVLLGDAPKAGSTRVRRND